MRKNVGAESAKPKEAGTFTRIRKAIMGFFRVFSEDGLDAASGHGAFFILIAFLPFCAILMMILRNIDIDGIDMISRALKVLPTSVEEYVKSLLAQQRFSSTGILSISIVAFVWASSSGMVSIIKAFRRIFGIEKSSKFFAVRALSIVYVIGFILALVLTAVSFVFGSSFYDFLVGRAPDAIVFILQQFRSIIGFVLLIAFFVLLYISTSKNKYSFICYLSGAVFTALGWLIFSSIFSFIVENIADFALLYGSLATIVILMLWLYFCLYIMFVGAEIVKLLDKHGVRPKAKKDSSKPEEAAALAQEKQGGDDAT